MKPKLSEIIIAAVLGLAVSAIIIWCFWSRTNGGGEPLVNGSNKVQVVGAKGETLTVTRIVLVDGGGNETLKINAGPPSTLEIKDARGRTKVIDLPALAGKLSFWSDEK
jgi:hypothetical protein